MPVGLGDMSYRKFSLPPLRVTQRPTAAPKLSTLIQRGGRSQAVPDVSTDPEAGDLAPNEPSFENEHNIGITPDLLEPTEHELGCRSSVAGWDKIRDGIRMAVTENHAMPLGQVCIVCDDPSCLRCQQCGPFAYYCYPCFRKLHGYVNIFHIPEQWEVSPIERLIGLAIHILWY